MKTNDPTPTPDDKQMNTAKMAKIDTFQFEAVTPDTNPNTAQNAGEPPRSRPQTPPRTAPQGEREYRFYATSSIKRVDTQTVNRMMTTTSTEIPSAPGAGRKPMTRQRMIAMLVPLAIIIAYIISIVAIDVLGLSGLYFRMTAVSVVLYTLYLTLTLIATVLLMFMDMLPKPLALLVLFVSIFCVHGNAFLMVPLILAFVAIGITIEGTEVRVTVCALAVIMGFYAIVLGVGNAKITYGEPVKSDDGAYILHLQTTDDGSSLSYSLVLETTGTLYRKYTVNTGYSDVFYFGEDDTIAFGEANEYGQPKTFKTVKIADIVK